MEGITKLENGKQMNVIDAINAANNAKIRILSNKERDVRLQEGKEDVVEQLASQVEELTAALNSEIEKSVELRAENEALVCGALIAEATEGLTDVQAEKMRKLAESVEFNDVESGRDGSISLSACR